MKCHLVYIKKSVLHKISWEVWYILVNIVAICTGNCFKQFLHGCVRTIISIFALIATRSPFPFVSRIYFMVHVCDDWEFVGCLHWNDRFLAGESLENLFILYSTPSANLRFCGLMLDMWTGNLDFSFSFSSSRLFGLKQTTRVSGSASCN